MESSHIKVIKSLELGDNHKHSGASSNANKFFAFTKKVLACKNNINIIGVVIAAKTIYLKIFSFHIFSFGILYDYLYNVVFDNYLKESNNKLNITFLTRKSQIL